MSRSVENGSSATLAHPDTYCLGTSGRLEGRAAGVYPVEGGPSGAVAAFLSFSLGLSSPSPGHPARGDWR